MNLKHVLRFALSFAIAGMLVIPVCAEAKTTFRLANTGAPNDDYTYGCEQFAKNLKEISKGDMQVKVMNNGVLGNDRVTTEMAQQGSIDFSLVGQSQFNLFVKPLLAMDLPYMVEFEKNDQFLSDFDQYKGKLYKYVDAEANKVGLKVIMTLDSPFRSYAFTSKSGVKDLASAKGVKARVTMSPIEKAFVNAIGMNPCPVGWTEVYTALQQGTVDGEIISLGTFAACNRAEIEDRFLLTRHNMAKLFVVMNKAKFDALSPEQQKMIIDAGQKSQQEEWLKTKEYDAAGAAYCAKHNIKLIELTDAEKAEIKKNLEPLYAEYTKNIDPEFIKLIKEAQK
ncbi:MAG: TRAP transporter substrate-binding protein [Mailhella sp.]|nr:TRAP transporter substrate-binding protein [Mailhella sp.]